jgi:hypothetical protein
MAAAAGRLLCELLAMARNGVTDLEFRWHAGYGICTDVR